MDSPTALVLRAYWKWLHNLGEAGNGSRDRIKEVTGSVCRYICQIVDKGVKITLNFVCFNRLL